MWDHMHVGATVYKGDCVGSQVAYTITVDFPGQLGWVALCAFAAPAVGVPHQWLPVVVGLRWSSF